MGQQGQLFIYGGSNHNLAAQRGEIAMARSWLVDWRDLVTGRAEEARGMGRQLAFVVVPEKLAVYADRFPETLAPTRARPALRLTEEARLPLVYPLDLLREARCEGETYLRTDSHLTPRGNLLLAQAVLAALKVPATLLPEVTDSPGTHLASGDLGSHFDPPELELMVPMAGASRARLVSDNWSQVASAGGHIGTTRIFRQDDPPDRRALVIFGDSYGFGDEAYRGLSWFLAQVFREVHFVWAPFGWDPGYIDSVGAELAICQTAERRARSPPPRGRKVARRGDRRPADGIDGRAPVRLLSILTPFVYSREARAGPRRFLLFWHLEEPDDSIWRRSAPTGRRLHDSRGEPSGDRHPSSADNYAQVARRHPRSCW